MTTAYPLSWPAGWPRTPPARRKYGRFNRKVDNGRYMQTKDISVADAVDRLQGELDRIGARLPVISSSVELRLDGLPRSGQRPPDDPGVALYFQLDGKPHCMPCDTYRRRRRIRTRRPDQLRRWRRSMRLGMRRCGMPGPKVAGERPVRDIPNILTS